jgi:Ca-activated chloride channel family protein
VKLEWPLALVVLALVPLAVVWRHAIERRPFRHAVAFTNVDVLATISRAAPRWRTRLPALVALLGLTLALLALARPEHRVALGGDRASIVLAVDTSGSMSAVDVKPTRLAAAEGAIWRFLAALPVSDRVALVTFSDEPMVGTPLTVDRRRVADALQTTHAPGQGTAIGDALARSVSLLEPAPGGAPAAILLLSDGAQTRGALGPLQGASRAALAGIPVYTVALGTPRGVINEGVISLPVPPDAPTLRRIALTTGGAFFAPTSEAQLNAVYDLLAARLGRRTEWRELTSLLVGLAAACSLLALALSLVWRQRLP